MTKKWTGAGLGLEALRGGRSPEDVSRAFAAMTPFEYHCATLGSHDPYVVLGPGDGIDRVLALREARARRTDLSESEWRQLVLLVYHGLSEQQRQNPTALLSALAAIRSPTGGSPFGGLTVAQIADALVSWSGDWPPTQDDFAPGALAVTDRRLRQVLGDAGTSWGAVIADARLRR